MGIGPIQADGRDDNTDLGAIDGNTDAEDSNIEGDDEDIGVDEGLSDELEECMVVGVGYGGGCDDETSPSRSSQIELDIRFDGPSHGRQRTASSSLRLITSRKPSVQNPNGIQIPIVVVVSLL